MPSIVSAMFSAPYLAVISFLLLELNSAEEYTLGTLSSQNQRSPRKGLFLNLNSPSPGNGTLTRWRYCYYSPPIVAAKEEAYAATMMVYRLRPPNTYEMLVESVVTVSATFQRNASSDGFICNSSAAHFRVMKGDVIGACNASPKGLHILSEKSVDSAVYFLPAADGAHCEKHVKASFASNTTTNAQLVINASLHVSADLELDESRALPITPITTVLPAAGQSIGTVAGLVAGVAALVVAALTIVCVVLCLLFRKTCFGTACSLNTKRLVHQNVYGQNKLENEAQLDDKLNPKAHEYEIALSSVEVKAKFSRVQENESLKMMDSYYTTPITSIYAGDTRTGALDESTPYYAPAKDEGNLCAQLEKQGIKIIQPEEITCTTFLGSGQFGTVSKAIWKGKKKGTIEVAVKTLKPESKQDRIKFLQEAAIMGQFKHPNIVTLYGLVTANELMLVVEFISKGDLKTHLVSMNTNMHSVGFHVTNRLLLTYAQQVALGMNYLSLKGFIHRDLAARNILVSDKNVCKIADFGLSRDLQDENCYISHGGKIPIKWTAPEAIIYNKFSTASDVWSYGCLLYELWTLGETPFSTFDNRKVIEILKTGYRLPPPSGCPRVIYGEMINCWHPEPSSRPTFAALLSSLCEYEKHIRMVQTDDDVMKRRRGVRESVENEYLDLQQLYVNQGQQTSCCAV